MRTLTDVLPRGDDGASCLLRSDDCSHALAVQVLAVSGTRVGEAWVCLRHFPAVYDEGTRGRGATPLAAKVLGTAPEAEVHMEFRVVPRSEWWPTAAHEIGSIEPTR